MQEFEDDTGGESGEDSPLSLGERAYMIDALQHDEREWIRRSTENWQAAIDEAEPGVDEAEPGADEAEPGVDGSVTGSERPTGASRSGTGGPDPNERGTESRKSTPSLGSNAEHTVGDSEQSSNESAAGDPAAGEQLHAIPELSVAHVRVLSRAGVDDLQDLVEADVETLRDLTGYDRALLRHWQALARLRL